MREIETSILREIIDEPMFLASPKENLHSTKFNQIYFTSSLNVLGSFSNRRFC